MNKPSSFQTLSYVLQENGVVHVAIDVKDKPVNVLTLDLHREIGEVAQRLSQDEAAIGAVIHSAKSSFMAGGDLNRIVNYYAQNRTPEQAYEQSRTFTRSLRKLETCGKPVAVAINGTALGGGLELALACHHRVVADDPKIMLGLPEVSLGLLPGGGGTQRLPRIIGLQQATSLILSSKRIDPEQALKLGIVDQLAPLTEIIEKAEQWILNDGNPEQAWDRKGFQIPGGSRLNDMNIGRLFSVQTARISAKYRHNYPAPIAALRCLFNGSTVNSMDAALRIESREFSALTRDPVARNLIRTKFINRGKLSRQEIMTLKGAESLKLNCERAFIQQGLLMAEQGLKPALIENAAFAAGFDTGPLALADRDLDQYGSNQELEDVEILKQRLLCSQSLAASDLCETGEVDPVTADLASVLCWSFPSYTGGVMSYIDTMGLTAFISLCDNLNDQTQAGLKPSAWLREQASKNDLIYPAAKAS